VAGCVLQEFAELKRQNADALPFFDLHCRDAAAAAAAVAFNSNSSTTSPTDDDDDDDLQLDSADDEQEVFYQRQFKYLQVSAVASRPARRNRAVGRA